MTSRNMTLRTLVVGNLLRDLIAESGHTQRQIAQTSEIDRATLSRFLNGMRTITDGDLAVLAWTAGITTRPLQRALVAITRHRAHRMVAQRPLHTLVPGNQRHHPRPHDPDDVVHPVHLA